MGRVFFWLGLVGCGGGKSLDSASPATEEPATEADADADADTDTDTDADSDTDTDTDSDSDSDSDTDTDTPAETGSAGGETGGADTSAPDTGRLSDTGEAGGETYALTLHNYPLACEDPIGSVAPTPAELGQWAAARLRPPGTPFVVEEVSWILVHQPGIDCNLDGPHRVQVWKQPAGLPLADPVLHTTLEIPSFTPAGIYVSLNAELEVPLTLEDGEELYVAVEMAGSPGGSFCIALCNWRTVPASNFWSNAVLPPYPWAELRSFGIGGDYWVSASGSLAVEDYPCKTADLDLGSALGEVHRGTLAAGAPKQHEASCAWRSEAQQVLRWAAPRAGRFRISLEDSEVPDLILSVLDGCGAVEAACADDTVAGWPAVEVDLEAGQEVLLVVAGKERAVGDYRVFIE